MLKLSLKFEASKPITLSTVTIKSIFLYFYNCRNTFTFTPVKAHSYTVEKTLMSKDKLGNFTCSVTVFDNETQQPVEILARTRPIQWAGLSGQYSASDFENNKPSTSVYAESFLIKSSY